MSETTDSNINKKPKFHRALRRAGFFALLVVLLIASSEALYRHALTDEREDILNRNTAEINLLKEPENTIDLIVLGDSLSYQVLSPMQVYEDMGVTSYIAGESLEDPVGMLHMTQAAFTKQTPKYLFIEAHALVHSDGVLYTAQELATDRITTILPVFRLHNLWKEALVPAEEKPADAYEAALSGEHLTFKGFHLNADVVPAGDLTYYMTPSDAVTPIPSDNAFLFEQILKECEKHGTTIVLFSSPSPANYDYSIHNGIQALADEHGLTYIDLNLCWQEIGIDWATDTVDGGDHLNILGAKKTTAYLENYIEELDLSDHRGDPAYTETWDEMLPAYREAEEAYTSLCEENVDRNK